VGHESSRSVVEKPTIKKIVNHRSGFAVRNAEGKGNLGKIERLSIFNTRKAKQINPSLEQLGRKALHLPVV
jgi:hypothetical protein